jgi:single-stranded-DNA-specific exonuclease
MRREWEIRPFDPSAVEALSGALGVSPLLGKLLSHRGIKTADEGRNFLSPTLKNLHDPAAMKGMPEAVSRISSALKNGERICIYGDYDVDGVTSTSLLLLFLRRMGLEADFYIPSRLQEGYGLNLSSIEEIASRGTRLLITADCGISDVDEVRHAIKKGMDVIIIDHHQVPDVIPPALAVLNPHQKDCPFPLKEMAAVGVTFNLVMALRAALRTGGLFSELEEPNLKEYLDLVSLGTVADIMPLLDENRIVTHFGLQELAAGKRPGIAALKEVSGLHGGPVSVGQIAFRLAPRINAIGRLGKAEMAVELMTTGSYSRALLLARELDQANAQRQAIEQNIYEQACAMAEAEFSKRDVVALILASEKWHVGVVGIVASRLVERFGCPAILIALDGDKGRGSARTVEGVHLYEALLACAETLETFGGHRAAAGLSIRRDQVEAFRRSVEKAILKQRQGSKTGRTLRIDAEMRPLGWTPELVTALDGLAPFGLGNPEPLFLGTNLKVKSTRLVGKEPPYHLKVVVEDGDTTWDAIGFRMGDRQGEFVERMDLVYSMEFNQWEGHRSLQLRLADFRAS